MIDLIKTVEASTTTVPDDITDTIILLELEATALHDELSTSLVQINESCRLLFNQLEVIEVETQYPGDKALEALYSTEAWNLSETIKTTIAKFKEFFKKIFDFTNKFTKARLALTITTLEQWMAFQKENSDKIDSILEQFSSDTHHTCSVLQLITFFKKSKYYFEQSALQVGTVYKLTTTNLGDGEDSKLNTTMGDVPITADYNKAWEVIAGSFSTKEETTTTTSKMSPKEGGWGDATKLNLLLTELKGIVSKLDQIKIVQDGCNAIVRTLEKESPTEDNLAQLNKEKIKFLKKVSKDLLSELMNRLGKGGTIVGKQCAKFNSKTKTKS